MAEQKGIVQLKGTIGNITFYKSKDGFLARGKGGVDGKRIATDPAFQRTRENGAEFGRAGVAGKTLRKALRNLLQYADSKMVSRLTKEMMKVIQADTDNSRGERTVPDGDVTWLEGFEFNDSGKLATTLYAAFTATINRVTGELKVNIPSFIPLNMIAAPAGTTHFRIVSAGAEIDFENETAVVDSQSTGQLAWDGTATVVIDLMNVVTANSTLPLVLALGIEFFQEVNGIKYPLKNGVFNALALVKIDQP